jgi:hypothetical protein
MHPLSVTVYLMCELGVPSTIMHSLHTYWQWVYDGTQLFLMMEDNFPFDQYQDPNVMEYIVTIRGAMLRHVNSEAMGDCYPHICKAAVQNNGYALEYVKTQTLELCRIAVEMNPDAIWLIRDWEIRSALRQLTQW